MNFQDLLAKMAELDQPATEAVQVSEAPVEECGEPMGMTPPMGDAHKDTPPPSMSVNLNAQGLDDIAELMKLMTKVNPDMINQPEKSEMPTLSISSPGMPGMGDRQELPPLKMLPDLDADNDNAPGGEIDINPMKKAMGDVDGDGDHDMDDHDAEDKEKDEATDRRDAYQRDFDASQTGFGKPEREDDEGEDEQDEAFANSVNDSEPEVKSVDYMNNQLAGGMNRPKGQHKHSYQAGDNPMAMEGNDLRASIRAELQQRLAEAKGAK
jgi:hypothetical protein